MSKYFTLFLIVVFFIANFWASVFPYPFFSPSTTLTVGQNQDLNDRNEGENSPVTGSSDIKVVNLDWFDVVDTFFEKYVTVRVIDINTKKQYYVKRTGGYNHADVEPIDSKNVENMILNIH